jgi:hypothetical protein
MSTETLTSILVVGASGRIGKAICRLLITHKTLFSRIAFFNDTFRTPTPSKTAIFSSFRALGMDEVSGTYYNPASFRGFDCVIMILGNHALKDQPAIIDTAISAGVRHFYPSEFGADLTVGENWNQRYYKYKVLTREHLEKRGKEIPELGWSYFQIGRFTEWSVISHFGINNKMHSANIFGTPEGKQSLLSVGDSLAYLLKTLKDPLPAPGQPDGDTKGRRRSYRFHGQEPTWAEIFSTLEKVTGQKYDVTYHHVEEALDKEKKAKEIGDVDLELETSHQLVQGREGTRLPKPWDNDRFPELQAKGLEEVLAEAFSNKELVPLLGLA